MADMFSQEQLENMLTDLREEVDWRREADRCCQYYDNMQLTPDMVSTMKERGLAPLVRNLISPAVNLVLGIEAKAKRDWKVVAEDDSGTDVADALSAQMKVAENTSKADRACSNAYASMVKSGFGCVEVAREANPFKPPYRVAAVRRQEISWDMRARDDLSDARYLVRRRWTDEDVIKLHFPDKTDLIDNCMSRWAGWDEELQARGTYEYMQPFDLEQRSTFEDTEWRDTDRKRFCLYEVWYKVWVTGEVMTFASGSVVEFDKNNDFHVNAVANGMATLRRATFPKVRLSWWLGPHRLADVPSPYPHNEFPYVIFFAFREDGSGVPYGIIRNLISPQDEVNARLSKMMWLLSGKRIIADSDALDMPLTEVAEEAARPDGIILTNPNRKNKGADAVRIETDFALSQQQFSVLQDAAQAIKDSAGIQRPMMGRSEYSGQSGYALDSLVQQGETMLAELNDNYRYARKQVGELLLSLIKEDFGVAPRTVYVDTNGVRRAVEVNKLDTDKQGNLYVKNSVVATATRLTIEDIQETTSHRAHVMQMLSEVAKSLPPQLQPIVIEPMIRQTDLPDRNEVANRIARAAGFSTAPTTPEAEAEAQNAQLAEAQKRADQERAAAMATQLQLEEAQARIQKLSAEVELQKAKAANLYAQADSSRQAAMMNEDTHSMTMDERAVKLVADTQKITNDRGFNEQKAV